MACTQRGWGQSIVIGVAGAGEEIHARPFLLVTDRSWRGTTFGDTRARTQLKQFVNRYMNGLIKLDEMVSGALPRKEIDTAFEKMREGEVIRSVILFEQDPSRDPEPGGPRRGGAEGKASFRRLWRPTSEAPLAGGRPPPW